MTDKFFLILNPNAGSKTGKKVKNRIYSGLKENKIDYEFEETRCKLHAEIITSKAIKSGYRQIIVAGGDGTLNEVLNGIMSHNVIDSRSITLGFIPIGTGNDWSKNFAFSENLSRNINLIKRNNVAQQDITKISFKDGNKEKVRYCINIAGLGFDALVAEKTNQDKIDGKSGKMMYFKNLINSFLKYKSNEVSIYFDGIEINTKLFSMAFGKGKFNGGGMKQLPNAVFDDGFLDITVIKDVTKFEVMINIPRLFSGNHIKHPKIDTFKTKSLVINSNKDLLIEIDGESVGTTPIKAVVIPKAINIFI